MALTSSLTFETEPITRLHSGSTEPASQRQLPLLPWRQTHIVHLFCVIKLNKDLVFLSNISGTSAAPETQSSQEVC